MTTLESILKRESAWVLGISGVRVRIRLEAGTNNINERRTRWEKGRIAHMVYRVMGPNDGVNGGKWHISGIQNADDVRGNFDRYIGTLHLFED